MRPHLVLLAMHAVGIAAAFRLHAIGAPILDAVVGGMALAALVGIADDATRAKESP